MYEDDSLLRRTLSLLRAQQEATIDGILVINERRRMESCNRRFLEMWRIPAEIAERGDDEAMLGHVVGSLRDPDGFLQRVMHLYAHPGECSRDEIELTDGRFFDRYSAPAIGDNGEHFGRVWVFRDVTEQRRAEAALRADLEQARSFQQSILAPLPAVPSVELDVVYRPLDLVGGDLYHVSLAGSRLRLFVADATGHGVRAGLTTMLLHSEYEAARSHAERPADLLRTLNERVVRRYGRVSARFTAVCADLDVAAGALRWSSAAHPSPCLLRGDGAVELATGGPFVGLAPSVDFPEWTEQLRPGDALCLYTDGVTEATDAARAAFDESRLKDALRSAGAEGAPLARAVSWALDAFLGAGRTLDDDATIVTARWGGAARP